MTKAGKRVVVADNDPDVVELVVTDLANDGHEIVGHTLSGDEAIELCRDLQPDVLVVDYRMPPGPNGVEVAKQVAQVSPDTKVVLYTNYRQADLSKRAARAGALYLTKGNLRGLRRIVADD